MTSNEALSKITDDFLKAFSEELARIFGNDIFSIFKDEEYGPGPAIIYLEGTAAWCSSFKRACKNTRMNWLYDWYYDLNWMESDEFDGELAEKLICFNTKNSNAIEEICTKIDDLKAELKDKQK